MRNTAAKKRVDWEDVDFDYPFANLPLALVEPLPRVSLLRSYFNPSLSGWTSRVAAHMLEGPCPNFRIDDLNPEQLRASTAGEGPVLTIAGAGTGKTKTLALSSIPTAIAYLF
jgi:hypothetical protein